MFFCTGSFIIGKCFREVAEYQNQVNDPNAQAVYVLLFLIKNNTFNCNYFIEKLSGKKCCKTLVNNVIEIYGFPLKSKLHKRRGIIGCYSIV